MKFLSQINVNTEYTLPIVDGNNGQVLTTDGNGAVYWGNVSAGVTNLDALTDVILTSPSSGQLLRYGIPPGSGEANPVWYNFTPTYLTPSSSIDALGDVTISTATTGQILQWNGSQWVNATLSTVEYVSKVQHLVKCGVAVTKGQAVYVTTSDGTNMIVGLASNATEATSSKVIGLAASTGAINDQIFVVTEGLIAGLNTSTATAGDPVWLGTGGNLIFGLANKPVAPAHLVYLGVVTRVQSNNGEIFVNVQNGFELNELHDVLISSPSAGQLIRRDSDGLWKNWTPNYLTSLPTHNHDDRYYTETEIAGFFGGELEMAGYNATNWDTAYSWGNHALAGYLTSFTETDPTVPTHVKTITTTEKSNWNTAYGWGNHALAGYATQAWVGLNYYNEGEIDDFFSGAEAISGYNKSNWDTAYGWGNHALAGYQPAATAITTSNISSQDVRSSRYLTNYSLNTSDAFQAWNLYETGTADLNPTADNWWYGMRVSHGDAVAYYSYTLATNFFSDDIRFRRVQGGVKQAWRTIFHTGNFTDNSANWNTAYNDRITAASVTGTSTKTLTLTQGDGGTVTATWTDYDTDNDAQVLTWTATSKELEISNGNSITLDGLATEDYVLSQGFTTFQPWNSGTGSINYTAGNVGIGTTSPGAKLHVVGNTYIQSGVLFVDTIAGYATNLVSIAANTNFTVPSGIITVAKDLGTNDYANIGQHNMQLRIRKASLDGGCAPRALELGVLDNGTGIIQANHCGVGYNTLSLNPVAGSVLINGQTAWHAGNDGAASGLDADLLDGQHGSYYQPASTAITTSNIGSQSVTYATNSTRLYASDSPYRYGDQYPYSMDMRYDGVYWNLSVTPATPSAVRVAYSDSSAYATSAGSATSASTALTVTGKSSISYAAHSAGANDYNLELYSSDTGDATKYVSLRFHQGSRYWGQIRYNNAGFRLTGGADDSLNNIYAGIYYATNGNSQEWNAAYNDRITAVSVTGAQTKTITLTQQDGGTLTATWTDYDTDNDAQTLSWDQGQTLLSISGGNDVTLTGLATEDYVNSQGFVTSSGTVAGVVRTVTGTNSAELVRGNMGDNDQARILVGATASNAGYLEIATADDGTEPIYVRQYTGTFTTEARTATLLDGSGNTTFPGTVTAGRYRGHNSIVLNNYTTVNPSSNVFLYSQPNDRDAWIFLDSADTGSNWGIYHRQIDSAVGDIPANSIGFVGGGSSTLQAYISLANGDAYFRGNLTIGGTFTENSSIRFKENIQPLEPALAKVEQLNPVTYTKITSQEEEIGLIAEEVAELFPEVVTYNENGQPQGIQYQRLSVILLKAVQELTERVNKLENK